MKHPLLLAVGLLFLFQTACFHTKNNRFTEKSANTANSALAEKFEPFDHFSAIRSWPERNFDEAAFLEAMQRAAEKTTWRGSGPCDPPPPIPQNQWRLEGPSNIAGRCNTLCVSPTNEQLILAGFASGGIFKTTDGGVNWKAVGDPFVAWPIATIVWHPTEPNVVFAGLGDPNISSYPAPANGLLRSIDSGETWQPYGNGPGTIVSKIVFNPLNANELWAAVMGTPFKRNNFRGIYRSTDGGLSWTNKLLISNQAGAIDLVINPTNPDVMFATGWDRIRTTTESLVYGPGTKIFKTTDGGQTWNPLTGGGLPTQITGRIGLAMSKQNPSKIYAVFNDTLSTMLGVWKSNNSGLVWTKLTTVGIDNAYSNFGWYFGKIRVNPGNDEEIFVLGLQLYKFSGGQASSFSQDINVHNDLHDLLFLSGGKRLVGCDGGVYGLSATQPISTRFDNLPTTQFYRVGLNPHLPGKFYGGAQDNGTVLGSSAGLNSWQSKFGGDGFTAAFHPTNPQIFYHETQNGNISATKTGGNAWVSSGSALGTNDRTNWDTPYFISPHNPNVLYAGTHRVHKNAAGPDLDWQPVSPDLTDGNIFGARFHNITCLDESKKEEGRLAVGTSDGNVWVKKAGGDWQNMTAGLPDRAVTSVKWSPLFVDMLYVSHSGYRLGEQLSYVHSSSNAGQTWTDLDAGKSILGAANDLLVLNDDNLFIGTDAGVYYKSAINSNWKPLYSNFPTVAVYDLDYSPADNRLVAATFGRGIWSLELTNLPIDAGFPGSTTVSGKINLAVPLMNGGVGEVDVRLTGLPGGPQNFKTSDSGQFNFAGLGTSADPLGLRFSKDINPMNGVSTFDLVKMSKHLLGVQPFTSPYQWIAADINKNKQVTTFDIVELRKLILGVYTKFPSNTSWRFLPKNYQFTLSNPAAEPLPDSIQVFLCDTLADDYEVIGIKIGDLNGDVIPVNLTQSDDRTTFPFWLKNRRFQKNERFEIELETDELGGLVAGQFTLKMDVQKLAIEKIEPLLAGMSDDHFGKNRLADGLLTASFEIRDDADFGKSGRQKIVRLSLVARADGQLSEAVSMENWPTPAAVFSSEGIENQAVISFFENENQPDDWQISPNPIGSTGTAVWLNLPDGSPVSWQLFGAAGQQLFAEKNGRVENGRLVFQPLFFVEKGVFFLKIEAAGRVETFRLVKI